jgi:hypothetical protein
MLRRFCFFISIGSILIAGCANPAKAPVNNTVVSKPVLTAPFRFHKLIESSPGQYYDILSWGRGSVDTGSFVILHSDSSGKKYTTTTGDLNGAITEVYNTDMDVDGNPEILIQAKGKDTVNYTKIYAYEFSDNKAEKLDFPKLSNSQKKGYRGNDNFYIEEGKLVREFPIYEGSGTAAKPTGQKMKLEYGLRDNSFTVKQLSDNFANTAAVKTTIQNPLPKEKSEKPKKETKKEVKKKKKHHEEEHHKVKHKKRRHHSSDDDND